MQLRAVVTVVLQRLYFKLQRLYCITLHRHNRRNSPVVLELLYLQLEVLYAELGLQRMIRSVRTCRLERQYLCFCTSKASKLSTKLLFA